MTSSSGSPSFIAQLLQHRILPPASVVRRWIFLICCGLSAIAATPAAAQFAAGVSLVEVYATVTDAAGDPLTGLTADAFIVEEDGQRQSVSTFAGGDVPLSLAIGIDRSFSVPKARLRDAVGAVGDLLTALRIDDRTLLLGVGSQAEILAPLGASRTATRDALATVDSWGSTPLHDAVMTAIDAIAPAGGRRALILISDGTDRYSEATATTALEHARHRDVIVYPVSTGARPVPWLAELATVTGGRSFVATDSRALRNAVLTIAEELRRQYLLGYVPADAAEGERWRQIRVRVDTPGARVRARDGYFATSATR